MERNVNKIVDVLKIQYLLYLLCVFCCHCCGRMLLSMSEPCTAQIEMLEKGERIYYPALGALICCRCFRLFSQAMPTPLSRRPHHCACMCDRREDRRRERNGKIFLFPCCLQGDYTISKILSNHQQCRDKDKENMYSSCHQSYQSQKTAECK